MTDQDDDDKLSDAEIEAIRVSVTPSAQAADPRYQAAIALIESCGWVVDNVTNVVIGPGGAIASVYVKDQDGQYVIGPDRSPVREHRIVRWGIEIPRAEPSQTTTDITKDPKCLALWQLPHVRGIRVCDLVMHHEGPHIDSTGFKWANDEPINPTDPALLQDFEPWAGKECDINPDIGGKVVSRSRDICFHTSGLRHPLEVSP